MKFIDYYTEYECAKRLNIHEGLSMEQWTSKMLGMVPDRWACLHVEMERDWVAERRPYYSIYPTIVDSLLGVSLDVDTSLIRLPVCPLLFRFGEAAPMRGTILSILATIRTVVDRGRQCQGVIVWADGGERNSDNFPIYWRMILPVDGGETIEEAIARLPTDVDSETDALLRDCVRIVLAASLLSGDLIEPDVLMKDRSKYLQTADEAIVQRAVRRGKRGWLIGASLDREVSPHFRRPHLALRWTGGGRRVPKVVPVRGTVVKRKKLFDLPSGYLD